MKLISFSLAITGVSAGLRRNLQESCLGSLDNFDFSGPLNCNRATSVLSAVFENCGHSFGRELRILTGASSALAAREQVIQYCVDHQAEEEGEKESQLANMFPIQVEGGCTYNIVIASLSEACDCNAESALVDLLSLSSATALETQIESMCTTAWSQVSTKSWSDINAAFDDDFMEDYVEGRTVLNTETGNLATPSVRLYPTSAESAEYGNSINDFYNEELQNNVLDAAATMESCQSHAMMCCWGRDRQSGDNNGQCRARDCEDKDPADNSNLCSVAGEEEGDIHCHGVAWSENPNDVSSVFKYNNLFYVAMYDHLYTRGYVENALGGDLDSNGIPMCGCIEEMPKVSRADCTEMDADIVFSVNYSAGSGASITAGTLNGIDFDACRGIIYGTDQRRGAGNDLASYVNRLVREERVATATQTEIHSTLVGFASPNDNENEELCNPSVV